MNTNKCPPDARSNNGVYSCSKISPNGNKCARLEGHMGEHHAHRVHDICIEVWTDEDEMNKVEIKSFIFKIAREQADKILDNEKDKPLTRVGLICEHGAIIPDTAEIVVEYDNDGNCYVASIDNLVRGPDKLFCRLRHDVNEALCSNDLPKFSDIFKTKEL